MIYTIEENRHLEYSTPLIDYIKSKHLYTNENLIYTKKYSDGTFSITNPTDIFTNCEFINGYPHFKIPLYNCIEEIEFLYQMEIYMIIIFILDMVILIHINVFQN